MIDVSAIWSSLSPNQQGYVINLAAGFTQKLIETLSHKLKKDEVTVDLEEVFKVAIAYFISRFKDSRVEYDIIFREYFGSPSTVSEISKLVDPSGGEPDPILLAKEFINCGFDPETIPNFNLRESIQAFFGIFIQEAEKKKSLRERLAFQRIKAIHNSLQQRLPAIHVTKNYVYQSYHFHIQHVGDKTIYLDQPFCTDVDLRRIEFSYLQRLANSLSILETLNIPTKAFDRPRPLYLEKIFVEPQFVVDPTFLKDESQERFELQLKLEAIENDESLSPEEREDEKWNLFRFYDQNLRERWLKGQVVCSLQDLQKAKRALLLGDSGSGKTTLLKHLARSAASHAFQSNQQTNLTQFPIFIQIDELFRHLQDGQDIFSFLVKQIADEPFGKFLIQKHLDAGDSLLFFDGLDLILEKSERRKLIQSILNFLSKYTDNQIE